MNNIMLDLEHVGRGRNAPIVAIGAREFDVETKSLGSVFYSTISLQSAIDGGGVVLGSTFAWWMTQSDEARREIAGATNKLRDVLQGFDEWLCGCANGYSINIWGNGVAQDNAPLADAYHRLGLAAPWSFRQDRCYRTLRAVCPSPAALAPNREQVGHLTPHRADHDATWQALHLINIASAFPNLAEVFR